MGHHDAWLFNKRVIPRFDKPNSRVKTKQALPQSPFPTQPVRKEYLLFQPPAVGSPRPSRIHKDPTIWHKTQILFLGILEVLEVYGSAGTVEHRSYSIWIIGFDMFTDQVLMDC